MSKSKNAKVEPVKMNKGFRRHNRSNGHGTIRVDVQRNDPKWEDVGGEEPIGILRRKTRKGQTRSAVYIRRNKHGVWESVNQRTVDIRLAPARAPEIENNDSLNRVAA